MERAELARLLQGTPAGVGASRATAVGATKPANFMADFASAVAEETLVFVCDPTWSAPDRKAVDDLILDASAAGPPATARGWLLIPTGGTTGGIRFARHDQDTIAAAVSGFCAHFQLTRVNAVGVLPLNHVSGLMAWMRCALTGGTYVPWAWHDLKQGRRPPPLGAGDWVLSLVPTQLQRLLELPEMIDWLRRFRIIFLGGGPAWPSLLDAAAKLPLSLSYGMTETAAMVTALRPEEFLAGDRTSGAPLPHAKISLTPDGLIHLAGESIFRGYYPDSSAAREFTTDDLGSLDAQGHLQILGRRDAVIITGGKKVHPADVEAALRASGEFDDIAVLGIPDPEWGEAVVACYPDNGRAPDLARAMQSLASHQRPKRFLAVPAATWPRTPQGKINRPALRDFIARRSQ